MFLVKYFKTGFIFPKLLDASKSAHTINVLFYFILLTFIANFPLTWLTFEQQGSRINFIEQNMTESTPSWNNLPNATVSIGGISPDVLDGSTYQHGRFIYYFGEPYFLDQSNYEGIIIFYEDYIKYIVPNGASIESSGYDGFKTPIMLNDLNFATGEARTQAFNQFAQSIEKSFSRQIILYTVVRNQSIQFLTSILYILLLSGIIQLFRFGFQNFLSYKEGLNFIILSSTLPSVLALIFGLILPGFAPVVYNLALGLVVMLVLLIYSRKKLY